MIHMGDRTALEIARATHQRAARQLGRWTANRMRLRTEAIEDHANDLERVMNEAADKHEKAVAVELRDALTTIGNIAAVLASVPVSPEQMRVEVEALAKRAACALSGDEYEHVAEAVDA